MIENSVEQKQLSNAWLVDKNYIQTLKFENKKYLEKTLDIIRIYTYKCPVLILTEWDDENSNIIIHVSGKNYNTPIRLDPDIAPHDIVTLIERDIYHYFPRYEIHSGRQIEVDYSSEEIAELIKERKIDVDDAFNLKKTVDEIDIGVIERVWILDDKFRFVRTEDGNTQEELRISKIPLSEFLKQARRLRSMHLHDFIIENSRLLSVYVPGLVQVKYTGAQLLNFLKINECDLYIYPLQQREDGVVYRYGRFAFLLLNIDKDNAWHLIEHKIRSSVIDLGSE